MIGITFADPTINKQSWAILEDVVLLKAHAQVHDTLALSLLKKLIIIGF
jgi:hypothetical protein